MPTKTQRKRPERKHAFKVRLPAHMVESICQQARVWRCTPDEAASRIVAEEMAHRKNRSRKHRTREDLEREASEIFPGTRPKVNFTAALRDLK